MNSNLFSRHFLIRAFWLACSTSPKFQLRHRALNSRKFLMSILVGMLLWYVSMGNASGRPFRANKAPPFMQGPVYLLAPLAKGNWQFAGRHFMSNSDWLALMCDQTGCALRAAKLSVLSVRLRERNEPSYPAQSLLWHTPDTQGDARVIGLFALNPGQTWLKSGSIPTFYAGDGRVPRASGPGTMESLIRWGSESSAKLVPVLVRTPPESNAVQPDEKVGNQIRLELRIGERRQILGSFIFACNLMPVHPEAYLRWAGDFDGDGRPDFLVSFHPHGTNRTLFLSSLAKANELVGRAGSFDVVGIDEGDGPC